MSILRTGQFLWQGTKNFGKSGFQKARQRWDERTRLVTERTCEGLYVLVTGANQVKPLSLFMHMLFMQKYTCTDAFSICMQQQQTQGLGYQVSLELAKRQANVTLVCRDRSRGEAALDQIKQATGNTNLSLMLCDVSSLQDIRALEAEYSKSGKPLHVLVNNAGVMVHESMQSKVIQRGRGGVAYTSTRTRTVLLLTTPLTTTHRTATRSTLQPTR